MLRRSTWHVLPFTSSPKRRPLSARHQGIFKEMIRANELAIYFISLSTPLFDDSTQLLLFIVCSPLKYIRLVHRRVIMTIVPIFVLKSQILAAGNHAIFNKILLSR